MNNIFVLPEVNCAGIFMPRDVVLMIVGGTVFIASIRSLWYWKILTSNQRWRLLSVLIGSAVLVVSVCMLRGKYDLNGDWAGPVADVLESHGIAADYFCFIVGIAFMYWAGRSVRGWKKQGSFDKWVTVNLITGSIGMTLVGALGLLFRFVKWFFY
jgi:hypothetical protein